MNALEIYRAGQFDSCRVDRKGLTVTVTLIQQGEKGRFAYAGTPEHMLEDTGMLPVDQFEATFNPVPEPVKPKLEPIEPVPEPIKLISPMNIKPEPQPGWLKRFFSKIKKLFGANKCT